MDPRRSQSEAMQSPPEPTGRIDGKLLGDTAWNYGAFALMAGTGVILNFFIAIRFGVETLGIFNQIYAVYIVAAQLAVFGIHDSAQKHTAEHGGAAARADVARSAILLAGVIGGAVAGAVFALSGWIGALAESAPVGEGVALAAPGLLFFALNKVLMGILNGQRRMKAFAVAQSFRVLTILAFAFLVAAMDWPGHVLGAGFSVAEVLLFPPLMVLIKPWRAELSAAEGARTWIRRHLDFGTKALPNGFLAESYIRVDILMLALFVDDAAVGVYSFAAMFIEGLYQVPAVVRTVVNPVLVRLAAAGDMTELARFGRRIMAMSFAIFLAAAAAALLIFPYLGPFFPDDLVARSYPVLMVLTGGLALYAAFVPLDFLLMQAGQPGWQSGLMTVNIAINAGLNVALIPLFGITGAAMATAIAFALSGVTLNVAVWSRLGLKGGFLLAGTRLAPLKSK
ncbi:MAG: oligosaccharide flippase family protein [Magnetovibrio sp.]|nr:oligosaccharide flippase family protein [Magnetovibrio sp.]